MVRMPHKHFWLSLSTIALMACGAATSTSSTSTETTGGGAATTTDSTDVSNAVPSDVVLSSPTASSSSAANLAVGKGLKAVGDADGEDFAAKVEALEALRAGTGECSFTLSFPTVTEPECYGPDLVYANHPEGTSKDSDTSNGDVGFTDLDGDGNLPTGDLGFWNETEGTQACAAAKMNALISKASSKVDNIVNLFGVMACAGKKADLELPAVGASVDLSTAMAENATVTGLTVNTAALTRLPDDADGNAVYQSALDVTLSVAVGPTTLTRTGEMTLTHVVTADDGSTYKGKLSYALRNTTENVGGCGASGATDAGVISYEKASATVLRQEFNAAQFCTATADVFDADLNINPGDKASGDNPDGWGGDWHFGRFAINPSDGTGSVAYAWQAGRMDGASRVLNVSVAAAADGSASGNAYFGYGADVESTAELGEISGFYCNWAGPNNRSANATKAQTQSLTRAAGAADFTAASSHITYAPTNSCDSAGTDGSGNAFGFGSDSFTSAVMDNDVVMGTAVTNDLIDLTDIVFTQPTAPTEI